MNFLSYVTDDPNNPGANVTRYLPGADSLRTPSAMPRNELAVALKSRFT